MSTSCPFCPPNPRLVLWEGPEVLALWDLHPAAPGHALIITRRHVVTWFDASDSERGALAAATVPVRASILERHRADGFTVGVNVGEAAGQTVPHLHLHLIPRRWGDVSEPRGGVRRLLLRPGEEVG
ncbi:MAG TPA: HIT family protein [Myxococcaceae bacterium]|nr:HIT family protein [Myxococcaceae bacterium]